ncbi:MAG TPA: alkaline phosphatase family protein [Acetobacteraceae bacterium]|nr:alkaline phosphatase family protein [Acetobacteraceae bacterium]
MRIRFGSFALLASLAGIAAHAQAPAHPLVTPQPNPPKEIAPFVRHEAEPRLSRAELIRALRAKVRYVFVIFNENHSFDNEYGTFPGANGLYMDGAARRDPARTPGFVQHYRDVDGKEVTVTPFRIGPAQNATFVDSVDHSHVGLAKKIDVVRGVARMDGFAAEEYERFASKGGPKNAAMGTQYARLVMSHIDCDTIPFFWRWASNFTLFDNIFATEDSPSAPNAIAMIAGQAGETQWVKHGPQGQSVSANGVAATTVGPPMVTDAQPFWGSQFDPTQNDREPRGSPIENYANNNIASNFTFATLPLAFTGALVNEMMATDRAPESDLADVSQDIAAIASRHGQPVPWRWYEAGYDHEPTDPSPVATHNDYVSHHNGAQYFGYIANNPQMSRNLRGLGDFFTDVDAGNIPAGGGVFYIRGGFGNLDGLKPPIQNRGFPATSGLTESDIAAIDKVKNGNDDHPAYSDRQISEAMAAQVINAIASRPALWSQSAIIITYDESDGFYDHVPPRILSYGPDGLPLARGVRIPTMVISPYARAHAVSHAEGDHNAVIETIEAIFDLPPLATLPDEKQALLAGADPRFNGPDGFVQHYLGPRDINTPETDDLLSAFDPARLTGRAPPLPPSLALTPAREIATLPHLGGKGCAVLGITPTDAALHIETKVPDGFNTLPATLPQYN